jgi:hypothetical protein
MWLESSYIQSDRMRTSSIFDVNLRLCPKPIESECPAILHIPSNSEVMVYPDIAYYDQPDGRRSTWRKAEYQTRKGWINERLLQN